MTTPAPGWYPDPHVPLLMRWWDGSDWTADTYERTEPMGGFGPQQGASSDAPSAGPPARVFTPAASPATPSGAKMRRVKRTDDGVPVAPWGRRAVARVIDGVIVQAVVGLLAGSQARAVADAYSVLLRDAGADPGAALQAFLRDAAVGRAVLVLSLVQVTVALVYGAAFLLWRAATPGKLALGLRVRRTRPGDRLTVPVVVRRWLGSDGAGSVVGWPWLLVDWLLPLHDRRGQSLHDKLADTVVVRR